MIEYLTKFIDDIKHRVMLTVGRAVVTAVYDDKKIQEIQATILAGETRDKLERFQQYGFTSKPFVGAEAITLSLGGIREHTVVIAVDDRRYRLKNLADGEVALYTDEGDKIHFKRSKEIFISSGDHVNIESANKVTVKATNSIDVESSGTATIKATDSIDVETKVLKAKATTSAEIESPTTTVKGNLVVTGSITGQSTCSIASSISGASVAASGAVSGATVTAGAINLGSHTHNEWDNPPEAGHITKGPN